MPAPVTPGPMNADATLEAYKAAYDYASSYSGMNLGSAEAREFADKMSASANAAASLDGYKAAYEYASSYAGINLGSAESRRFAEATLTALTPAAWLETFKKLYSYANSYSGLNLGVDDARSFATRAANREDIRGPASAFATASLKMEPNDVTAFVVKVGNKNNPHAWFSAYCDAYQQAVGTLSFTSAKAMIYADAVANSAVPRG